MSIEAGFFESAYRIWADRAEAKKKGAIVWAPRKSTWELIQMALSDEYKGADQLAQETGRHIKTVRSALADHYRQMSRRKIKWNSKYEWRMKSREVGPGRGGV